MWANEIVPKFAARPGKISEDVMKCYKTGYTWDAGTLKTSIAELGTTLRKGLGMEIAELDEIQSKFYKAAYVNVPRMNKLFTEQELNDLRRINK
jgi:hypothetical protein